MPLIPMVPTEKVMHLLSWRSKMKHFWLRFAFIALVAAIALPSIVLASRAASQAGTERISHEVRHEILMLPYYGVFDFIAFKVDGSKVTLIGQVTRPTLKSSAERVVKDIEGVESVDNRIEVLPVSPNDDRLRLALYRAIYRSSALERYAIRSISPIRIIVKNGNATLEGLADSPGDKNLAGVLANGVPGVFSVTNNLQVATAK